MLHLALLLKQENLQHDQILCLNVFKKQSVRLCRI